MYSVGIGSTSHLAGRAIHGRDRHQPGGMQHVAYSQMSQGMPTIIISGRTEINFGPMGSSLSYIPR